MDVYGSLFENQTTVPKTKESTINKNPLQLLKISLARQYAKLYSNDLFIGITGSFGANLCLEASKEILSQKFKTLSTIENSNSVLKIAQTLLKLTPQTKKVILDMTIEYIGEMDFYLSLVSPKIIICTKISHTNSEFSGDLKVVLQEVSKVIEQIPEDGFAILDFDDPNSKKLADKCKGTVIYYGTDPKNCTVWAGNIQIEDFRTTFELNLGVERVKVNLQLLGVHKIYPILAAATLGVLHNIPLTKIKLGLEKVLPQEHKLQPILGPNGSIILDDSFDSSLMDMEAAIDTMFKIPARRRILVLGEMRGLGQYSEDLHRRAARMIYKEKVDQIYLGTGDANIIADELKSLGFWDEKLYSNLQNSQIVGKLLKNLGRGDVCLIKGSKTVRLDEVVKRIAKKQ